MFPTSKYLVSGIALVAIVLTACIKEEDFSFSQVKLQNYDGQYAAPIVNSTLSIKDILKEADKNGNIQEDASGFLTLAYDSVSYSIKAEDALILPNGITNNSVNADAVTMASFATGAIGTTVIVENSRTTSEALNFSSGLEIDAITFKGGNLVVEFPTVQNQTLNVEITIPNLKLNNVAFTKVITIPAGATAPYRAVFPVNGDNWDLTNGNANSFNSFTLIRTVAVTKNSADPLPPSYPYTIKLESPKYTNMVGYFGQLSLPSISGNVAIKAFNNDFGGTISFDNPLLKIRVENQMGLPISLNSLSPFYATSANGTNTPITGFPANYMIQAASSSTNSWTDLITLDKNNSNIQTVANTKSNNMYFSAQCGINPAGMPATRNFVSDTSKIKFTSYIELPLQGTASDFAFVDTVAFNMRELTDSNDIIKSVLLRINVDNGFPMDNKLQIYFLHPVTNVPVSVLFPDPAQQPIFASAAIDANGIVTNPTNKITDVVVTGAAWRALANLGVKRVILKAQASSTNNGNNVVKIYSQYQFKLRMGLKVSLTGNFPQ